jgi:peptidylprolyl isomerase
MRRLAALVLAATLVLAGCSSANPEATPSGGVGRIGDITVSASDTRAPALEWADGLVFESAQAQVLWSGEGEQLIDRQPILLDIYIQSLETGEVLQNTYDGLPRSFLFAPEFLGQDLYDVLSNQRIGSRALLVAPKIEGFDDETALAVVVDVLPDRADGTAVNVRNDLPIVINGRTGEPDIVLREGQELPAEFTVATLIRGDGEQVQQGSYVVAQYKAIFTSSGSDAEGSWVPGGVFDSTWPPEKAPYEVQVGVGETIRAIDEGLIDQTVGSQVMIVAPESWGYPGKGTLVFVIDILDVWTPSS